MDKVAAGAEPQYKKSDNTHADRVTSQSGGHKVKGAAYRFLSL
jgi:hypothetical protein